MDKLFRKMERALDAFEAGKKAGARWGARIGSDDGSRPGIPHVGQPYKNALQARWFEAGYDAPPGQSMRDDVFEHTDGTKRKP